MRLIATSSLSSQLALLGEQQLTYRPTGKTAGLLPSGFHHLDVTQVIGHGPEAFQRATDALVCWHMHRRSGLLVEAEGPAEVDRNVAMVVGRGIGLLVPCRVTEIISGPDRSGFAYGTLPGHPESGEERFEVRLEPDGSVSFTVRAYSNPGSFLVKVLAPLARVAQRVATRRYVTAMRGLAAGA